MLTPAPLLEIGIPSTSLKGPAIVHEGRRRKREEEEKKKRRRKKEETCIVHHVRSIIYSGDQARLEADYYSTPFTHPYLQYSDLQM
jgi:hypothetical protein